MKLPTWTNCDRDEEVYALRYPSGGHHAMCNKDEPESMFGIICSRDREVIETWLTALNMNGIALECIVDRVTLGDLIAEPKNDSYTIWIMDNGFEDREIIHF